MRICSVDRIPTDAVLAKNIYDARGRFLLKKDFSVRQSMIRKLKSNGIFYIYIHDNISEGIEINTIVDDEVKADIIFTFKNIVEKKMSGNRTPSMISSGSVSGLENLVNALLTEINSKSELSYVAIELMGTDMSTYSHSVNTAIISILIAMDMQMDMDLCKNIGLGAILHDVGKIKIDNDILNKISPFNPQEMAEMRRHSEYGYEMMKSNSNLNGIAKSIILYHHEKLDGSGYPTGIMQEAIPKYVRVVTVADMFDAMTSDRVYRERMAVHQALESLMVDCVSKIDTKVYSSLISKVVMYPPGVIVVLNEGSRAIVTQYNQSYPTRPKIRILQSHNFTVGSEIDLTKVLNILIESTEN